jgi:hypothetical protein
MLNRTQPILDLSRVPVQSKIENPKSKIQSSGSPSNYLIAGILIGLVFGFVMGTLAALTMGDKSLLFAQHLWNRIFNVEAEGEKVHFEWLLQ